MKPLHRHSSLSFLVGILLILICSTSLVAGEINPYKVLGVSSRSSQEEVRKQYKKLCLKFHPDKNVHKSKKERQRCEAVFKSIQHAYSLIGDEESRSSFHQKQTVGGHSRTRPADSTGRSSSFFYRKFSDPMAEAIFRALFDGGSSFPFHQRGIHRSFSFRNRETSPQTTTRSEFPFKSIYLQKVKIPLETLYVGVHNYEFHLSENIWTRWRAAIRGQSIFLSMYQGLIYSLPIVRTSAILAVIVGLFITHATLPRPDPSKRYTSSLRPGSRGNSLVTFASNGELEVIFEIVEAPHNIYTRKDNDLYTTIHITAREARRGCTKEIPSLESTARSRTIAVTIPPGSKGDDTICLQGMGWPIQHNANKGHSKGDLHVRLSIISAP